MHRLTGEWQTSREPNCTVPGEKIKYCSVCGEVGAREEIPTNNTHVPAVDAAVEATCEHDGCTEGSHCSLCNTVLVEQQIVPQLAHTPASGWVTTKNATCEETGLEAKKCTVCLTDLETRVIDAKGHNWNIVKGYAAKVGTPGLSDGVQCIVCEKWQTEQKPTAAKNPAGTSLTGLTKASKAFTAKWKKSTSANATGYQIRYSLKSNMSGSKTVTVKGYSTASKKITGLKAKKKYYVQIRVYKDGKDTNGNVKTYYSGWSAKKNVTTK